MCDKLTPGLFFFFSSTVLELAPVLEELPTGESSTGEKARVWPVKYAKEFLCLASKLPLQLFPHLQGDAEIPLFSLYFWSLPLLGT